MLLPGLDGTGRLYDDFTAALPSHLRLQPMSYPADEPLDYEGLAERVRPALPAGEPWILVGESFSGPLALRLASERPPGLAGVILVATFGRRPLPVPPWLVPTFAFRIRPPRWLVRRLMFEPGAAAADVDGFTDTLTTVRPATLAARARAALGADVTSRLSSIEAPLLYLRSGADRLFSASVLDELKRHLPQLDAEVVPDAPHLVLQRRPREAADAIARWIAAHVPASELDDEDRPSEPR